ncbi:TPA: hypothetical protein SMF98_003977 [Serratia marcescens]|nr:hypothetical protein [Serratia marcescens]
MNGRLMMACCVLSCLATAGGEACAQEDGSLGAVYARLLMLSSTEDISTSSFRSDNGVAFDKFSLPYEVFRLDITDRLSLSGIVRGGYLKVKGGDDDDGLTTRSRLDIFSAVSGLVGRYHISDEIAVKNGVELGYARMRNRIFLLDHASGYKYRGDMRSHNGLVIPMVGVEYANELDGGDRIHAEGSISWMYVSSFNTNNRPVNIRNENAGSWSLSGEYTFGDAYRLLGWPMDVMVSNKLGGFYGAGYREIDMGFMNNTELATGTRIRVLNRNYNVRVGIGYLMNDNGRGISLVIRMN